jgi:hypothetical protein
VIPKPEKGSENSVYYYKKYQTCIFLEEAVLTDKSRLYKQKLSFKGCSIP